MFHHEICHHELAQVEAEREEGVEVYATSMNSIRGEDLGEGIPPMVLLEENHLSIHFWQQILEKFHDTIVKQWDQIMIDGMMWKKIICKLL